MTACASIKNEASFVEFKATCWCCWNNVPLRLHIIRIILCSCLNLMLECRLVKLWIQYITSYFFYSINTSNQDRIKNRSDISCDISNDILLENVLVNISLISSVHIERLELTIFLTTWASGVFNRSLSCRKFLLRHRRFAIFFNPISKT